MASTTLELLITAKDETKQAFNNIEKNANKTNKAINKDGESKQGSKLAPVNSIKDVIKNFGNNIQALLAKIKPTANVSGRMQDLSVSDTKGRMTLKVEDKGLYKLLSDLPSKIGQSVGNAIKKSPLMAGGAGSGNRQTGGASWGASFFNRGQNDKFGDRGGSILGKTSSAIPLIGFLGVAAAAIAGKYQQKIMEQAQYGGVEGVGIRRGGNAKVGMTSADVQRTLYTEQKSRGALGQATGMNWVGTGSYARGTGIDPAQAMQMAATMARYSTADSGSNRFDVVSRAGTGAGFKGAANVEFVNNVVQAVREGVSQGFAGTPEDIAKNMAGIMRLTTPNGQNVWGKVGLSREAGLGTLRGLQGNFQQAANLQGGAQQEAMFSAVLQKVRSDPKFKNATSEQLMTETSMRLSSAKYTGQNLNAVREQLAQRGITGYEAAQTMGRMSGTGFRQGTALMNAGNADITQQGQGAVQASSAIRGGYGGDLLKVFEVKLKQEQLLMGKAARGIFEVVNKVQQGLLGLAEKIAEGIEKLKKLFGLLDVDARQAFVGGDRGMSNMIGVPLNTLTTSNRR